MLDLSLPSLWSLLELMLNWPKFMLSEPKSDFCFLDWRRVDSGCLLTMIACFKDSFRVMPIKSKVKPSKAEVQNRSQPEFIKSTVRLARASTTLGTRHFTNCCLRFYWSIAVWSKSWALNKEVFWVKVKLEKGFELGGQADSSKERALDLWAIIG